MARVRQEQTTYLVTTAGTSPAADRRDREKRYLILMGIRVLTIGAAIAISELFHLGWIVILLIAAAMVLPWIAVVGANAGPGQQTVGTPTLWSPHRRKIGAGDETQRRDDVA